MPAPMAAVAVQPPLAGVVRRSPTPVSDNPRRRIVAPGLC